MLLTISCSSNAILVSFGEKQAKGKLVFPALPEKYPKFNSSSTPVPTNLRLSGGRRLFFLKHQINFGLKNLAKRIENLNWRFCRCAILRGGLTKAVALVLIVLNGCLCTFLLFSQTHDKFRNKSFKYLLNNE